jgi:hypothetical protein
LKLALLALAGLLGWACVSAPMPIETAQSGRPHAIFVVRRALHTGIALQATDLEETRLRELARADGARIVEFGWGDAAYYQANEKSPWLALATIFPSDSVVSVLALPEISRAAAGDYEVVELPVSAGELRAVIDSIEEAFATNAPLPTGRTRRTDAGELRFHAGKESFHLLRMCNRWTTDRLRVAGCAVRPLPVLTPNRAMREARRCAAARTASPAARSGSGTPLRSIAEAVAAL